MGNIHNWVTDGDLVAVRGAIALHPHPAELVNEADETGRSPLYLAVTEDPARSEIVALLLAAGADPNFVLVETFPAWEEEEVKDFKERFPDVEDMGFDEPAEFRTSIATAALRIGNVRVVQLLHESGADFLVDGEDTAISEAIRGKPECLELVRFLIRVGFDINGISSEEGQTPVHVAYRSGYFDVLAELLDSGAEESVLAWTPLHRAAAIGTEEDVQSALALGIDSNAVDGEGRTALHVALGRGRWDLADKLLAHGSELDRTDEKGQSCLEYAASSPDAGVMQALLQLGPVSGDRDLALRAAISRGRHRAAELLLLAGVKAPEDLLGFVLDTAMVRLLVRFGTDLSSLGSEDRRRFLGLTDVEGVAFEGVSREMYFDMRFVKEGLANPQDITDPFRLGMIRSGWGAYGARHRYSDPPTIDYSTVDGRPPPVWCFDRFGQSVMVLPDGRIVLVAGEHEDFYDPDFCIYNDVTVFGPEGAITVYGYPYEVFPPTDFHSATLVGSWIYLIGSLGYSGWRTGNIPVFRLSVEDFHIESVVTHGEIPGRLYKHRATLDEEGRIEVVGGKGIEFIGGKEQHVPNSSAFVLDLESLLWAKK